MEKPIATASRNLNSCPWPMLDTCLTSKRPRLAPALWSNFCAPVVIDCKPRDKEPNGLTAKDPEAKKRD
jgi:hypothetical protein